MKIAVIAADGRSGRAFVHEALKRGHQVRAGIYGKSPFDSNPKLEVVKCNALKLNDVRQLVGGQEAIVSLIGHTKGSSKDVQTYAIKNCIMATMEFSITRIISLTGTGVRFPGDSITLMDRVLNLGIRIIDPARVRDGITHVAELKNSDLEWTVLRVLKLQDVSARQFVLTEHGPPKLYVGRSEVAEALVDIIEKRMFIQKAPIISKA